jgi:DNA-directed RNA polymerase I subunit RPA49
MSKNYKFELLGDAESEVFIPYFSCIPQDLESLKFEAFAQENGMFKKRKVLKTETTQIEYVGENSLDLNSRYLVGVLDEKSGTIKLQEATPVQMSHTVKSERAEESNIIKDKNYLARNELGQTFGTKKRQKIIKAQEMNKVHVENLKDVASKIKETISENAPSIPLKADIDIQTMADRLIPPCNVNASDPSQVYNFNDLFSESLIRSVDVKSVWKGRTLEDCYNILGIRFS